ncbi:substrate-binding domain-containing protein [uncultured Methylibium sp.]|uniref:substrate-binding domain-containing protein n=1 Tax=uncultured Methylibium sp. TaxID=381093 RepID=UPI0025F3A2C7|nr:substrate-binding domain-containing protein [uncultured Methylibium sp.]
MMTKLPRARWIGALALSLLAGVAVPAAAQDAAPRKAFRVCQDPNNLPFSSLKGEGIENKIAELFAKDLGLPVEYFSFPQRLAFVRNTLRYKLPGADYPCDIIMGVPAGFDQVSVTKPYYRSTYALVYAKGKGLDGVQTIDDFLKVDRARLDKLRIGIYDRSPASEWLNKHQLVEQGVPYQILNADPNQYPGEIIERDLASGKLDAAIVWGPIAGYFAKKLQQPQLVVVPMRSEPGVKFDFQMAMGVRYGEREWKQQIEGLIEKRQADITAILRDFGVPLLDNPPAPAGR